RGPDHAREVARQSRPSTQTRDAEAQDPRPEPLRELHSTAHPQAIETPTDGPDGSVETNGTWPRVDQELRPAKPSLRASKWRDSVSVEHLPAATGIDLLDGRNDHRPHVVHFSGHASTWGVLLEDNAGSQDGAGVEFALL